MRNISFHLTTPQFIAGTKDVTRRLGWKGLKAGDVLAAVEKGQGLKKGEKVKVIGFIKVVSVRLEPLTKMVDHPKYGAEECRREGFPDFTPEMFITMFLEANRACNRGDDITRIEFIKVDADGK